jgi:hypothetical protein
MSARSITIAIFITTLTLVGAGVEYLGAPWVLLLVLPLLIFIFIEVLNTTRDPWTKEQWVSALLEVNDHRQIIEEIAWKRGEDPERIVNEFRTTAIDHCPLWFIKFDYYWLQIPIVARLLKDISYNIRYNQMEINISYLLLAEEQEEINIVLQIEEEIMKEMFEQFDVALEQAYYGYCQDSNPEGFLEQ